MAALGGGENALNANLPDPTLGKSAYSKDLPNWKVVVVAGVGAILVGAIAGFAGLVGLVMFPLFAAVALLIVRRETIVAIFSVLLGAALFGYAVGGRAFAHLGFPPIYVGEVLLPVALVVVARHLDRLRATPMLFVLIAFVAWGALRTIPLLSVFGLDALRDGASWGYAAFAPAVWLTLKDKHLPRIAYVFERLAPIYLLSVPLVFALSVSSNGIGSEVFATGTNPAFKAGDAAVHLAGIAGYFFLLYRADYWAKPPSLTSRFIVACCALLWLIDVAIVASRSRGGLVAIVGSLAIVGLVGSLRKTAPALIVLVLVCALAIAMNPEINIGQRPISPRQIATNAVSIAFDQSSPDLAGPREWRLQWWGTVWSYTVDGPFFWTGKGFGVNLADEDGFQVTADHSLRSPHSAFVMFLARAGVPGLTLWCVICAAIISRLALWRNRSTTAPRTATDAYRKWLLVYLIAALINMTFDVYLEGPQGGIWWWSLAGAAIALTEVRRLAPNQQGEASKARPLIAGGIHPELTGR